MPSSTGLLVTALTLKAKWNLRASAILLVYSLYNNYLKKSSIFSKNYYNLPFKDPKVNAASADPTSQVYVLA